MNTYKWVIYLITESGNGKVAEYGRYTDDELEGTELFTDMLAKGLVIRIEREIEE